MEALAQASIVIRDLGDQNALTNTLNIHILTDNTSALRSIWKGNATSNQSQTETFRSNIFHAIDSFPNLHIHLEWCPGHKDVRGNKLADKLAKEGCKCPILATPHKSRAFVKSHWKSSLQDTWRDQWTQNNTNSLSWFAPADAFPPQLKPNFCLKAFSRELLSRTIQVRTGHAFTGEYYRRFVPSENPECPCGHHTQSRKHLLETCPMFRRTRSVLRNSKGKINLEEILGTRKGVLCLAEFLKISTAFSKL